MTCKIKFMKLTCTISCAEILALSGQCTKFNKNIYLLDKIMNLYRGVRILYVEKYTKLFTMKLIEFPFIHIPYTYCTFLYEDMQVNNT